MNFPQEINELGFLKHILSDEVKEAKDLVLIYILF